MVFQSNAKDDILIMSNHTDTVHIITLLPSVLITTAITTVIQTDARDSLKNYRERNRSGSEKTL